MGRYHQIYIFQKFLIKEIERRKQRNFYFFHSKGSLLTYTIAMWSSVSERNVWAILLKRHIERRTLFSTMLSSFDKPFCHEVPSRVTSFALTVVVVPNISDTFLTLKASSEEKRRRLDGRCYLCIYGTILQSPLRGNVIALCPN